MMPLRNTLIDGELVIDVDPRTKQVRLSLALQDFAFNFCLANTAVIDIRLPRC